MRKLYSTYSSSMSESLRTLSIYSFSIVLHSIPLKIFKHQKQVFLRRFVYVFQNEVIELSTDADLIQLMEISKTSKDKQNF